MKTYTYGLILCLVVATMGTGCTSWLLSEARMDDAEKTVADPRPVSEEVPVQPTVIDKGMSDRPASETTQVQPAIIDKGAADLLVERPAWPTLKQERPPVKVSLE